MTTNYTMHGEFLKKYSRVVKNYTFTILQNASYFDLRGGEKYELDR